MAVLPLALVLSREPLIATRDGKDGLQPLDVVVHSSVTWLRAVVPQLRTESFSAELLNATACIVLMPSHWDHAGAWQAASKAYSHLMVEDQSVRRFVQAPFPNAPVLGSYAVVLGALLALFVPGLSEYTLIGGCLAIMRSRVKHDMESQQTLHLMTTCAALMLLVVTRG